MESEGAAVEATEEALPARQPLDDIRQQMETSERNPSAEDSLRHLFCDQRGAIVARDRSILGEERPVACLRGMVPSQDDHGLGAVLLPRAELHQREPTIVVVKSDRAIEDECASGLSRAQREVLILGTGVRERRIEATELGEEAPLERQVVGVDDLRLESLGLERARLHPCAKNFLELQPVSAERRRLERPLQIRQEGPFTGDQGLRMRGVGTQVPVEVVPLNRDDVVIAEQEPMPFGQLGTSVASGGSSPTGEPLVANKLPGFPDHFLSGGIARIVDHYQLAACGHIEREHCVESDSEGIRPAIRRNDDAERCLAHVFPRTSACTSAGVSLP